MLSDKTLVAIKRAQREYLITNAVGYAILAVGFGLMVAHAAKAGAICDWVLWILPINPITNGLIIAAMAVVIPWRMRLMVQQELSDPMRMNSLLAGGVEALVLNPCRDLDQSLARLRNSSEKLLWSILKYGGPTLSLLLFLIGTMNTMVMQNESDFQISEANQLSNLNVGVISALALGWSLFGSRPHIGVALQAIKRVLVTDQTERPSSAVPQTGQ